MVYSIISEDSETMKELKKLMLEKKNEIYEKLIELNEEITIKIKIKEQIKSNLDYSEKLDTENLERIE